MQVQSNRVNNQTSFGTANVLTKTFKYLPKDKQIRSIAYITMGKIEPSLKEISKGVKLELGVKDYNKDNLFVSLTKRAILGKKHRFFMMIPAEKIGRSRMSNFRLPKGCQKTCFCLHVSSFFCIVFLVLKY